MPLSKRGGNLKSRKETHMEAYQKKVLAFLLRECHEAWFDSSCDEGEVGGLTLEEREILTRELYRKWGEEDEYQGPNTEFSISSLCDLAQDWLKEEHQEKSPTLFEFMLSMNRIGYDMDGVLDLMELSRLRDTKEVFEARTVPMVKRNLQRM